MNPVIHPYAIYPVNGPRNADTVYRECMKKHEGKIPSVHRNEREFICDLFLHDVKIRETMKECIADIPVKEKLVNLFF